MLLLKYRAERSRMNIKARKEIHMPTCPQCSSLIHFVEYIENMYSNIDQWQVFARALASGGNSTTALRGQGQREGQERPERLTGFAFFLLPVREAIPITRACHVFLFKEEQQ